MRKNKNLYYCRFESLIKPSLGLPLVIQQALSINRKGESWLLKVEIEGVPFPIYLEESEVVAALPENFETLSI
ncbi:hypothetical protein [Coleofasciculus sp. FACHB-1120]|uniref:hypothetical protein n=1 Tax=Coleofasciculus sp. FACHB-1120 TaxID=2692783 RepID=UPI001681E7B7|nr:hypothetical protein [Coleofasciculus sp. FACHB-1120]MBD2744953.1 hypothetical protein [Coleofasciculus sp. FACHB-1120]